MLTKLAITDNKFNKYVADCTSLFEDHKRNLQNMEANLATYRFVGLSVGGHDICRKPRYV